MAGWQLDRQRTANKRYLAAVVEAIDMGRPAGPSIVVRVDAAAAAYAANLLPSYRSIATSHHTPCSRW